MLKKLLKHITVMDYDSPIVDESNLQVFLFVRFKLSIDEETQLGYRGKSS